jgi:hypothetical protein
MYYITLVVCQTQNVQWVMDEDIIENLKVYNQSRGYIRWVVIEI